MGQTEVYHVLEKKDPNWLTANEIAEILKIENTGLIRRALEKLLRYREVFRREIPLGTRAIRYQYRYREVEGI